MTPDDKDAGGTVHDAPNQEVVGVEPPWVEGTGGDAGEPPVADPDPDPEARAPDDDDGLDDLSKDELIETASERGVDVTASMTKDEIKAAIRAG